MSIEQGSGIPFIDFGGDGEVIHLAHANGFPTASYKLLAKQLSRTNRVIGMEARPLWPNADWESFHTWETAANDLIRFLDEQQLKGIIGAGHSFGAIATLIASNKRPDLFSKLILIESVILPKWVYILSASAPYWLLKRINPVAKKASKRTETWNNRNLAYNQFRKKKVFANMSDEALWDYVTAATAMTENGKARLRYSKEWETRVYLTISDPRKELLKVSIPFVIFRGETSDTITQKVWQQIKELPTAGNFIEMSNSGHLVPFEKPLELSDSITQFIQHGFIDP